MEIAEWLRSPSLPFTRPRTRKSPVQCFHRLSVAIFDGNVEAERVAWRWLEQLRSHALVGASGIENVGVFDCSRRPRRGIGGRRRRAVNERPHAR